MYVAEKKIQGGCTKTESTASCDDNARVGRRPLRPRLPQHVTARRRRNSNIESMSFFEIRTSAYSRARASKAGLRKIPTNRAFWNRCGRHVVSTCPSWRTSVAQRRARRRNQTAMCNRGEFRFTFPPINAPGNVPDGRIVTSHTSTGDYFNRIRRRSATWNSPIDRWPFVVVNRPPPPGWPRPCPATSDSRASNAAVHRVASYSRASTT